MKNALASDESESLHRIRTHTHTQITNVPGNLENSIYPSTRQDRIKKRRNPIPPMRFFFPMKSRIRKKEGGNWFRIFEKSVGRNWAEESIYVDGEYC